MRRLVPIALAMLFVIAGCGPRDQAYAPSNFAIQGSLVPADLVLPAGVKPGPLGEYDGLFVAGVTDAVCCWIAPKATIFVKKPRAATTFVAGFYIPKYDLFENGQEVTVRISGESGPVVKHIPWQQSSIHIPLSPRLQSQRGLIRVEIDSRIVFVPSRDTPQKFSWRSLIGMRQATTQDDRQLGAILLYAYFD